jgi:hypothetical protein
MQLSGDDRTAIQDLVSRYNMAHDTDDVEGWLDTFTEDATFITGRSRREGHEELRDFFLNGGEPVFHYPTLFAKLFAGKEKQRPLYDAIADRLQVELPGILFIPTKTYISLEEDRVFGCAKINKTNIRLGLDLGDEPFGDYVRKGVGLGAMPNITHMIELTDPAQIDESVAAYTRQAYERAHGI